MGVILGMLPHPWSLSAGTASLLSGKCLLTQVYIDNVKTSTETATCTCICFRWPQNNSATYKSLMSNISQMMGNCFDFRDVVSQKNPSKPCRKKTKNPQNHKPQVRMVSEVKMVGSFWALVRMRDVFRVDEHHEKKHTKTFENIYQNFRWSNTLQKNKKPKTKQKQPPPPPKNKQKPTKENANEKKNIQKPPNQAQTEKEGYGAVQIYLPWNSGYWKYRGKQTQLSLKEMTLIHINAAESFHQKQQNSTVMTKITFLICTTVYVHIRFQSTHLFFICSFALSRKNQEDCLQFSLILDKCSPDGCGLKGRAAFLPEEEENC